MLDEGNAPGRWLHHTWECESSAEMRGCVPKMARGLWLLVAR